MLFRVLLHSFLLTHFAFEVGGAIVLEVGRTTYPDLEDRPSSFGSGIPLEGIQGTLLASDPPEACTSVVSHLEFPWIALVRRSSSEKGGCHFATQVYHVQKAGASAAIVYDDVEEALLIMGRSDSDASPTIPSTFVSMATGELLKSVLDENPQVTLLDTSGSTIASGLATLILSCLALSIVITTFYLMRLNGALSGSEGNLMEEADTLTSEQLEKLPIVVYSTELVEEALEMASPGTKGDELTKEVCPICIDEYEDGEKVRVLPCFHLFHKECIDYWLVTQHKSCPVCKYDSSKKKVRTHFSETLPLVVHHPELRQSYSDITTHSVAESLLSSSLHSVGSPSGTSRHCIQGDANV